MEITIKHPDDWEPYQDEVRRLYFEERLSLKQVLKEMREHYGVRATERQYKRLLHFKNSGQSKKIPASAWVYIRDKLKKRSEEGRQSEVLWDGKLIAETRLRNELSRYQHRESCIMHNSPSLSRITIRSPPPSPPIGSAISSPISATIHSGASPHGETSAPEGFFESPPMVLPIENQSASFYSHSLMDWEELSLNSDVQSERDYGNLSNLSRSATPENYMDWENASTCFEMQYESDNGGCSDPDSLATAQRIIHSTIQILSLCWPRYINLLDYQPLGTANYSMVREDTTTHPDSRIVFNHNNHRCLLRLSLGRSLLTMPRDLWTRHEPEPRFCDINHSILGDSRVHTRHGGYRRLFSGMRLWTFSTQNLEILRIILIHDAWTSRSHNFEDSFNIQLLCQFPTVKADYSQDVEGSHNTADVSIEIAAKTLNGTIEELAISLGNLSVSKEDSRSGYVDRGPEKNWMWESLTSLLSSLPGSQAVGGPYDIAPALNEVIVEVIEELVISPSRIAIFTNDGGPEYVDRGPDKTWMWESLTCLFSSEALSKELIGIPCLRRRIEGLSYCKRADLLNMLMNVVINGQGLSKESSKDLVLIAGWCVSDRPRYLLQCLLTCKKFLGARLSAFASGLIVLIVRVYGSKDKLTSSAGRNIRDIVGLALDILGKCPNRQFSPVEGMILLSGLYSSTHQILFRS